MKRSFLYKFPVIFLLVLGITGCDIIEKLKGDSESSIPPIPPVLPELQLVQPNLDLFTQGFTEQSLEDTSGYELASLLINNDFNPFVQSIFNYTPFLEGVNLTEPESKNGKWEWNYTHIRQSQNYDIRVISKQEEDTNIRDSWTLFISNSEQDVTIENYKLMEITIEKDISNGYWTIYPWEFKDVDTVSSWQPNLSVSWDEFNDNNSENYYSFNIPSSNDRIDAWYRKENFGGKFTNFVGMAFHKDKFEAILFNISWNSDTKEGSVSFSHDTEPGMGGAEIEKTLCWDENLNDIDCQF